MSDAERYTAQQAADPLTPGQVLADIAALRPDLRPAVASNPSAYPSLLEWLGGLGEPSVDTALRQRAAAPAAGPTAPSDTAADGSAPYGSAPYGTAPYGTAPYGTAPYGTGPSTAPYGGAPSEHMGAPAAPYGGASPTPFGGAGSSTPYGAAPSAPYGAAPTGAPGGPRSLDPYAAGSSAGLGYAGAPGQQPYTYQTGAPVKKSNKALWIVLGVVAFFIVLAVVGVFVIRGLVSDAFSGGDLGTDPTLDSLVTACENEDWAACDQLFNDAPLGSEYEEFGDTCGNRTSGGTYCVEEFGEPTGSDTGPTTYGDDPALDVLWDACAAGDGQACGDLYFDAPFDSEYEEFGRTCGGTQDGSTACEP